MKIPTSRVGNRTAQGLGFSLIELLVVLTIMVAATLAIAGAVPEFRRHSAVDAGAAQLASMMRKARMLAIATERTVVMSLDLNARQHWINGSGVKLTLPVSVAVDWRRREPRTDIRFHPDGSADSLGVFLSDGDKQLGLVISPVTGHVVVQR